MFGLVPGGDESASRGSSTSMNWMKNLKGRSLTSDCSDITDNFRGSTTEQKKPKPPGNPKSSTAGVFPTPPPTSNPNGATLSTVQQFGNVTNFKQYRSTRPALLEELNAILNSRLQKDAVTDDARMHNFQVYREAFQRFIDDFNIYKQFLTSVKHEYDSHIEKFAYEIRTVTALRTELATKEQEYGMLLRTVERAQEHKMVDIDNEKRALEKSLKEQAAVLKNLQLDNVRLTSAATKAIKDFEELRATCNTLTNSLSRLEAERRVNQATQAAKVHEFIALKSTAQKSLDEIDRLRHDKHDLEAMQSQMVSQDVVTEHQVTIDNLRSEIKTKELTHKDLIYRYSLLKQTIDMTWSQHVPAAVKNKERNANAAPNAKAPSFKQQTEEELKKLKDLGNHTSSARVLVETLLNQVIDLQKTNNESNPSSVGGSNSFGNANAAHNIDGAVLLSEEEFSSPWSHFVGMGYDENNDEDHDPHAHHRHHHGHHQYKKDTTPASGVATRHHEHNVLFSQNSQALAVQNAASAAPAAVTHTSADYQHILNIEGIPKFFQYEGKVANMFLTKWETETIVNEIWDAKAAVDDKKPKPAETCGLAHDFDPEFESDVSFADFYWEFIQKKFDHNREKAIAFSYNFVDALKKYSWDSDCKIFLLVLQGQLAEYIRDEQLKMIEHVQSELIREENVLTQTCTYTLTSATFNKAIRKILSYKNESSFVRLENALTLENKGNRYVHYLKLLGEDESGNQGHYCEMLRAQHLAESIQFTEHVVHMIMSARPNPNATELTVGAIREAIMRADPHKPRNEVNSYLARGAFMSVEDMLLLEANKTMLNLALFLKRMKRGILFPSNRAK